MGTYDRELSDKNHELANSKLTPELIRNLLLVMLLINAGADKESLDFLYHHFYHEYPIMEDIEKEKNRMPMPNVVLPSRCMLNTCTRNSLTDHYSFKIEKFSSATSLRSKMARKQSRDSIRWNHWLFPGLLRNVGPTSISATSRL